MKLPYYYKYNNNVHALHGDSSTLVFIRHYYESKVLKLVAQAMLLALLIMVLPQVITTNFRAINDNHGSNHENFELLTRREGFNSKSLPLIFHDLANEGLLLKANDKLFVLGNNDNNQKIDFGIFEGGEKKQFIVSPFDLERSQGSISKDAFDFIFSDYLYGTVQDFIDRALRVGGVVTVRLGMDPNLAFQVPGNYKIVYFRKIDDSTFIAMKKMTTTTTATTTATAENSSYRRKLLEFLSEEKKAILGNLEDVLLEPPRSSTGKSKAYLRKTKFLPDLLNDSLEGYPRRVYIDVGGGHGSTRWFEQNYPKRNKNFDMYKIETVPETETMDTDDGGGWEGPPTQMGISDWLWKNVKAEEYVVMKAEAEVVEELLKSKAVVLVDELFLECKPFGKGGRTKRAYWECLALYGRLRDFGVAVHQWWG